MNKQSGACWTVKAFLIVLLVAAGAASAVVNVWLAVHRTIEINLPQVSCVPTRI